MISVINNSELKINGSMTENSNNSFNIPEIASINANNGNAFLPETCRTCSSTVNNPLHMVCINSTKSGTEEISFHNKFHFCYPELDLRINSKATLCVDCYKIVNIIYEFIYRCNKSEGLLNEHFDYDFPYKHNLYSDCNFTGKEEIKTEIDVSGTETNSLTYSQMNFETNFNCFYTEEGLFKCSHCDYSSEQKTSLINHLQIHTEKKPYKCSRCNYRCNDKGSLIMHLLTHTREKSQKCSYCNYSCIFKSDLLKHQHIHTGEKPYKCFHCNYSSIQKSHIIRHLRVHRGKRLYKCSHCNRCYGENCLIKHALTCI